MCGGGWDVWRIEVWIRSLQNYVALQYSGVVYMQSMRISFVACEHLLLISRDNIVLHVCVENVLWVLDLSICREQVSCVNGFLYDCIQISQTVTYNLWSNSMVALC